MSSSVFKEVTSLDSESDKMNGNLVIVVKRDGSVSVDKQILQELLSKIQLLVSIDPLFILCFFVF